MRDSTNGIGPMGTNGRWRYKDKAPCRVHCSECDAWYDEDLVTFVNIEEDIQGQDLMTFECHVCKTRQTSHRVR
jgi:hypothetical protein